MKDLYRSLEDQLPELLQAIATAWQVTLPDGAARLQAQQLGDAMLAPGALERVLTQRSPAALALLGDLVRAGGVLPAPRLAPAYGEIRRDGPARLIREQPWNQPANPLEELYYVGLIDRGNATVGAYTGQAIIVPTQWVERLRPLLSAPAPLGVAEIEPPAIVRTAGAAIVEDLFALLVAVRHERVPAPPAPTAGEPQRWPRLDIDARLQGEPDPTRLALVAHLAWRLGLVRAEEGVLRPGPRAREWLRISDQRRLRSAFLAWRDDRRWNELRQLRALRSDQPLNPASVRHAFLEVLAECPPERWLALDSFLAALKRRRADYLRSDADYTAWRVTDVETNELLTGAASWERVEGALARHLLTTSLRWLGLVAIGQTSSASEPTAFAITAPGAALLAGAPPDQEAAAPPLQAAISDDLVITLPLTETLHERWQLERFAQWQSQAGQASYRVTPDSLWRGYNAGVQVEQVQRFLTRISGDRLPAPALHSLLAWSGRFGRVRLSEVLLLEAQDEHTMKQITSRAELRALLGAALSPTTCLVDRSQASRLIAKLRGLGVWPKLGA
ncbi:MAG: hypothetical protein GX557_10315 [Chloroflexi bacterium]|nr:hypothetical protein [Chloroflexota bacterium]